MNNESQKLLDEVLTETNKSTNWWPLIGVIALFIILWFLNGWLLMGHTNDERGTMGDMFGASNSLFSGLALAAVAYSIWLQRNELQLQRKVTLLSIMELKESVAAQRGSEEAQRAQVQAITLQTQETINQTMVIEKQANAIEEQNIISNSQHQYKILSDQINYQLNLLKNNIDLLPEFAKVNQNIRNLPNIIDRINTHEQQIQKYQKSIVELSSKHN